jgi:hypothetical protein
MMQILYTLFCTYLPYYDVCSLIYSFITFLLQIIWRKDGKRVQPEKDENVLIGPDGSLTLRAVREEDAGNYECVAKNEAFRRESPVAVLSISELRNNI